MPGNDYYNTDATCDGDRIVYNRSPCGEVTGKGYTLTAVFDSLRSMARFRAALFLSFPTYPAAGCCTQAKFCPRRPESSTNVHVSGSRFFPVGEHVH